MRPAPEPSSRPVPGLRLAWLFDVDGTLLHTGGASRDAFAHAVREHLGVEDGLGDIAFAGRTEPLILGDILRKHGRTFADGEEAWFWNAVFDAMRVTLRPGRGQVLPGVPALLERVTREPGWVTGLLTGNMTEMARLKLAHYALAPHFAFGGFGEQAVDRDALACALVARVARDYGVARERCIVVGDTPNDVACARAAGTRVIAVATGGVPRETLAACAPDLLLDDLTDTDAIVAWARAVADGG